MRVLFAIGNPQTSKSIVEQYKNLYDEDIEYKDVYAFKFLLEEVKKDKDYDRIVINEELEPLAVTSIDEVDRFVFNNIDKITDEIDVSKSKIILICADRRTKSDSLLSKLYGNGIYSILLGADRSISNLCTIIKRPKTKRDAKEYLRIDYNSSITVDGGASDETVNEDELIRIRKYYDKMDDDPEKYIYNFDRIAEQYSPRQLKVIAAMLPAKVQDVLRTSDKYGYLYIAIPQKNKYEARPHDKITLLDRLRKKSKEEEDRKREEKRAIAEQQRQEEEKLERQKREAEEMERKKILEEQQIAEEKKKQEEKIKEENRRKKLDEERLKAEVAAAQRRKEEEMAAEQRRIDEENRRKAREKEEAERAKEQSNTVMEVDKQTVEKTDNVELEANNDDIPVQITQSEVEKLKDTVVEKKVELNEIPARSVQSEVENPNGVSVVEETTYDNFVESEEEVDVMNQGIRENEVQENEETSNFTRRMYEVPKDYRKIIAIVGANKSGTTFIANAVANFIAAMRVNTALLDMTKDKGLYYIYNRDDSKLRRIALDCMKKLSEGVDSFLPINRNLRVYTSIPGTMEENRRNYKHKVLIETVKKSNNLVIADCDFTTPVEYFEQASEIYIVQDLDILKLQETTSFLRDLKNRNIDMTKFKLVINKFVKTALKPKELIEGLSYYKDPEMSFFDNLFENKLEYITIPLDIENYVHYVEGIYKNSINYGMYTSDFKEAINNLCSYIYPVNSGNGKKKKGLFS